MTISLHFWGVRGSLPTPGPATLHYGGNTPCISLRCGPHLVILDAGSGLRALGDSLAGGISADLLLSHAHIDHICGLPFFRPMFDPTTRLRIWGGGLTPAKPIAAAVGRSLSAPLMPNLHAAFRATIDYRDIAPGEIFALQPGLTVASFAVDHPGGALAYRIGWEGASLCYVTDAENAAGPPDHALAAFVAGTDVLICDASYTDADYPARVGWGHSTWEGAVRLADAAGVGTLVLFHHDFAHDDDIMESIAASAAARRPGTLAAREGQEITIAGL